jgi:thioredoxin 1
MEGPINVTDDAFERAVVQSPLPVVAVLWERSGSRADDLRAVLEAIAQSYSGEVRVVRLEASDAPQAHAEYVTGSLPQFLFFRDGQLLARMRGLPTEKALSPWVEYLLGRGPAPAASQPKTTAPSKPVAVTDADFDSVVLNADLPAVVDFWAAWCGPCRTLAPVVERVAADYAGRVLVAKLDVEANPATAQRFGAMSIPTLVFFRNGQEAGRMVGAQAEEVVRANVEALVGG